MKRYDPGLKPKLVSFVGGTGIIGTFWCPLPLGHWMLQASLYTTIFYAKGTDATTTFICFHVTVTVLLLFVCLTCRGIALYLCWCNVVYVDGCSRGTSRYLLAHLRDRQGRERCCLHLLFICMQWTCIKCLPVPLKKKRTPRPT